MSLCRRKPPSDRDEPLFSIARLGVLIAAAVILLSRYQPQWATLGSDLTAPNAWVQRVGPDRAAATSAAALLWFAGCWLAVGLVFALIASTPGRAGRRSRTLAEALLPALLQRLVLGAAGVSLVLSPVSAFASSAPSPAPSSITLVVPTDDGSGGVPTINAAPVPVTARPNSPQPPVQQSAPSAARVAVQPGDSLWRLAQEHLGPHASAQQVAIAWPRLYAANRTLVGADPGLLRPGQILTYPAQSAAASSAAPGSGNDVPATGTSR